MVEIHKKFSIPVACLVFVFIGVPLGVMARRGGIGTGVVYSVAFYLLYWICMIRGEVLADRLIIRPWVAMWAPNIIVGLGGLFLVLRMSRENYLNNISLPQKLFRLVWRKGKGPAA
jgi:lipopolysaccharide export system permease protein